MMQLLLFMIVIVKRKNLKKNMCIAIITQIIYLVFLAFLLCLIFMYGEKKFLSFDIEDIFILYCILHFCLCQWHISLDQQSTIRMIYFCQFVTIQ